MLGYSYNCHLRILTLNILPYLPVLPLIFHSIKDEIPSASQQLITRLYQLWLVLLLTLIVNMVACIFILLAGGEEAGRDLGASILYVLLLFFSSSQLLTGLDKLPFHYFHYIFPVVVSVSVV